MTTVSKQELESISTPNSVETFLGTLEFFDGVPTDETVTKVYDNLDVMCGAQVFLNTLGGASMYRLRAGNKKVGVDSSSKISIFSKLLDSQSLYLTANTSTLYAQVYLDTETDGPTVIEVPPGMLGMVNDSWFRWVEDLGLIGPTRARAGSISCRQDRGKYHERRGNSSIAPRGGTTTLRCLRLAADRSRNREDGDEGPELRARLLND